jgi:Tfp pilus assembly protein PilO
MRFILPIILIGISITGFFLFTDPLYNEMNGLREKASSYDEALDNSKALEDQRDKLTQKLNSFDQANLDKLSKLLPDSVDNIRLILEIEKIAAPYGMVLKDVKYETIDEKNKNTTKVSPGLQDTQIVHQDYGVWDLGFSTQGSYSNFYNFVKDLEKNLRIVDVVSVDFSSSSGVGVNPALSSIYKYDFKIKTYWLKN